MPELRRDPVMGRWVIIATERSERPSDYHAATRQDLGANGGGGAAQCPFCEGREEATTPEILAYRARDSRPNGPGWRVRVIPNKFPALKVEGSLDKRGDGIYDVMSGIGAHEVILETPRHVLSLTALSADEVREVLFAYRDRMVDLKRDRRLVYGLLFKNVGAAGGASLEHTHSQLICTPTVPKTVWEEMTRTGEYFRFRGRCLFCDMIRQEQDAYVRIVKETEHFVSFAPYAPRFAFETWILPKRHASHFEDCQRHEVHDLAEILRATLQKIEKALDVPAYNYIVHTAPFDRQEMESYHWHVEVIPRHAKVAGFEWGTDFYINTVPPESAAEYLRGIEVPA